MSLRTYIDGTEVFLSGGRDFGYTDGVRDPGEPFAIRGGRTSTIRVANTRELQGVVGSERMNEDVLTPRHAFEQRDGGQVVLSLDVVVTEHDREEARMVGISGNSTWLEAAKSITLSEAGLGPSDPVDTEEVLAWWSDEDALLHFPLADVGFLEGRTSTFDVRHYDLRPGFRWHVLLDRLMAPHGFRFVPKGRVANWWKKVLLYYPKEVLSAQFYGHPRGVVIYPTGAAGYTLTDYGSTPNALNLSTAGYDPASQMSGSEFTPDESGEYDIRVDGLGIDVDSFSPPTDGEPFYLVLYDTTAGAVVAESVAYYSSGDPDVRWWHDFPAVELTAGNVYRFGVQRASGGYAGTATNDLGAIVSIEPVDPFHDRTFVRWTRDEIVYYAATATKLSFVMDTALPRMSVMDVLNDLDALKCLHFHTDADNGVVEVWHDADFFDRPGEVESLDLTDRMDHTDPPTKVREKRARYTRFRFREDEDDEALNLKSREVGPPGYGNGDVFNPYGYGNDQEVELGFAATAEGEVIGLAAPVMRDADGDYQVDEYSREPRLLIDGGMQTGTWKFGAVTRSEYPYTYFTASEQRQVVMHFGNTGFPGTLQGDWARNLRRQQSRILECRLFLTDEEVRDFDFGRPVMLDDGGGPRPYYILEIKDHIFGQRMPTRVRAVEVDGIEVSRVSDLVPSSMLGDFNDDFNNDFYL